MIRLVCAVVACALLAAGCTAAGATASVREVEVILEHSRFVPSVFEVRAGETVRFVVNNTDPIDHEFILGDDEVQARHENGSEEHHGEVPGEVSVTYTFTAPGRLTIACHLPGHYDYGMRALVEVSG
jgi:uncharacterized cupredoxin-like copper-binding protein